MMRNKTLIILLSLSYKSLQQFVQQPDGKEVNLGEDVSLACKVGENMVQCRWTKDKSTVRMQKHKYEWAGRVQSGDCSIKIKSTSIDQDTGLWQCTVYASETQISREAFLSVRYPPDKVVMKEDSYILNNFEMLTLRAGDLLQLCCESIGGNPSPELNWSLNGLKGTSSNNIVLNILNEKIKTSSSFSLPISRNDNLAVIKCSVTHPALKSELESTVILNVLYPPHIENHAQIMHYAEEGDSLTLNCEVNSNPAASIFWYKSGKEGRRMVGSGSMFQISDVSSKDAALYQCQAENDLGLSKLVSHELKVLCKS